MNNKFSILLPVRNGGEYLKTCVSSILNQSLPHFNLIILDNNSQDGSLEWAKSIQDQRVVVYASSVSLSMEQNWGRIKDVPKNEFITLIGHDDLLEPNYLEEMNRLIAEYPDASIYQTHFNFINADGQIIKPCQSMQKKVFNDDFLIGQINQTIDSTGTGYMFRSKDYDKLGGIPTSYPNLIFGDYQLWMQLISLNYMAVSEKMCFAYRLHNSLSKQTNGELYQIAFEKYFYFLLELSKNDKKIKSVLDQYGKKLLMYYCESLCHRLLKTDINLRKVKVGETINNYEEFAKKMIPSQVFEPRKKLRIKMAEIIDNSMLLKKIFLFFKK
jgi:glycosyltransferase involved in cell wall biosynthesis